MHLVVGEAEVFFVELEVIEKENDHTGEKVHTENYTCCMSRMIQNQYSPDYDRKANQNPTFVCILLICPIHDHMRNDHCKD